MSRRIAVVATAAVLAAGVALPALAAPKKPIKGTYNVQLLPDPTANVFTTAGQAHLCGAGVPKSTDRHAFQVPGAGILKLVLDAQDPKPGTPYVFDWDIYLLGAGDEDIADGTTGEAHEEVVTKFKKAQAVTFLTCNLNGQPNATISYTFTAA